jgi:hypothetical protein
MPTILTVATLDPDPADSIRHQSEVIADNVEAFFEALSDDLEKHDRDEFPDHHYLLFYPAVHDFFLRNSDAIKTIGRTTAAKLVAQYLFSSTAIGSNSAADFRFLIESRVRMLDALALRINFGIASQKVRDAEQHPVVIDFRKN